MNTAVKAEQPLTSVKSRSTLVRVHNAYMNMHVDLNT